MILEKLYHIFLILSIISLMNKKSAESGAKPHFRLIFGLDDRSLNLGLRVCRLGIKFIADFTIRFPRPSRELAPLTRKNQIGGAARCAGLSRFEYKNSSAQRKTGSPSYPFCVGRSDRIRTCGIDVPNAKFLIFCVIWRAFRGFLVRIDCFRVLLAALNPGSPKP